jgi:hypothetical protein
MMMVCELYFFIGRILANCEVPEGRAMELENLEEHGRRALEVVAKHTPPELRPRVLQALWEGTEKRWGYFDGVYIKYVMGYNLGNQP